MVSTWQKIRKLLSKKLKYDFFKKKFRMVLFSIVFLALKEVVIFTLGLFCSSWIILSYSTTKTEFEYLLRPYSLHFGGHAHFSPEHSWLVLNRSILYGYSFKKKNQNKCDSWLILKQIPKNMSESVLRPLLVSVSESVSGPKNFTKKVFYAVSDGWHQETSIIEWLLTWSWKQLMRFVYNCS